MFSILLFWMYEKYSKHAHSVSKADVGMVHWYFWIVSLSHYVLIGVDRYGASDWTSMKPKVWFLSFKRTDSRNIVRLHSTWVLKSSKMPMFLWGHALHSCFNIVVSSWTTATDQDGRTSLQSALEANVTENQHLLTPVKPNHYQLVMSCWNTVSLVRTQDTNNTESLLVPLVVLFSKMSE